MSAVAVSTGPLAIEHVAAMDRAAFVAALGDVFEHAPWVAEAAWPARPFADVDALHDAMMGAVNAIDEARIVAFLCRHPELAGKEAVAGTMTEHSTVEQRGAGLDALSREERDELRSLNATYLMRHGFPFIVSVRGHDKAQVFTALRRRIDRDTDVERREALAQVRVITRRRLDGLFAAA